MSYVSLWLIGYGLGVLTGVFGTLRLARCWAREMRLEDVMREYHRDCRRLRGDE